MEKCTFYESLVKTKEDVGLYSRRTEKSERKVEKTEKEDRGGQLKDGGGKRSLREEVEDKMKEGGR